jgi:site-specific DNA recombinase
MESVAAYVRSSSLQQDQSPERQRKEIIAYCKDKGFNIVEWYVDEGKSGHKVKRSRFEKMLKDCSSGRFSRIVCWDSARFTRGDILESGPFKTTLRESGILLDTVKDGTFDYDDEDSQLKDTFYSINNKKFLKTLSSNTVSGRTNKVSDGYWMCGTIPYGYDRVYLFDGKEVKVARNVKYAKGRNERLKLSVNEEEAEIVKFLFTEYSKGVSLNELVRKTLLSKQVILAIFRNPVYYGNYVIGHNSRKKFKFNKIQSTMKVAPELKVVEKSLFDAVQNRLTIKTKRPISINRGMLSGFLVCSHCGYRLCKREPHGEVKYFCESALKRPGKTPCCSQTSVFEKVEFEKLKLKLTEYVKAGEYLNKKQKKIPKANLVKEKETLEKNILKIQKSMMFMEDGENIKLAEREIKNLRMEIANLNNVTMNDDMEESRLYHRQILLKNGNWATAAEPVHVDQLREILENLGMEIWIKWEKNDTKRLSYSVVGREYILKNA